MGIFSRKSEEAKAAPAAGKKTDIGRNDPCHCGSGKKYKKCHEEKDAAATHAHLEKQWQAAEKEAEKKAEEEKAAAAKQPQPPNAPFKPGPAPSAGGQKRKFFSLPKFSMSRRTGGG